MKPTIDDVIEIIKLQAEPIRSLRGVLKTLNVTEDALGSTPEIIENMRTGALSKLQEIRDSLSK